MKRLFFTFRLRATALGVFAACLLPGSARADVRLPGIFGDHMVLQQEAALPVWGWANPQEKVIVTFGNERAETTAGSDGKWRVDLPALPPGTPPGTLTIAAANTITLNDVLVGEVWLCSGQSNMELPLTKTDDAAVAAAQANDHQLRLCMAEHNDRPASHVKAIPRRAR
jgi:sialate O-acetylesterase